MPRASRPSTSTSTPPLPPPATGPERRRHAPIDRDALLDAAERVILRDGIGCFTLDSVAAESGLSKSGLLHHFPGKDALIDAMVHRAVQGWRDELWAAYDAQPKGPGRFARATMGTCLASTSQWTADLRRRGSVLIAALVHDPDRVQPLRDCCRDVQARVGNDGLPPGAGEVVRLVLDGLWFGWIFGFAEPTPRNLSSIRRVLTTIVDAHAPGPSSSSKKAPPRTASPRPPNSSARPKPARRSPPHRTRTRP